jgi:hypothetical protein
MRDSSSSLDSSEEGRRRGPDLFGLAIVGVTALIAWPAIKGIARQWRIRHPLASRDSAIDESLKDTFPASDPPASRYVDIPGNRRQDDRS